MYTLPKRQSITQVLLGAFADKEPADAPEMAAEKERFRCKMLAESDDNFQQPYDEEEDQDTPHEPPTEDTKEVSGNWKKFIADYQIALEERFTKRANHITNLIHKGEPTLAWKEFMFT